MRKPRLSGAERQIEESLLRGEYTDVEETEFKDIAEAVAHRRKDAVLNIRVNSQDLAAIKKKAAQHGIKYQTFVSELLHRFAHSRPR
jgi:predicted DNA binding CopG/RHH family protein